MAPSRTIQFGRVLPVALSLASFGPSITQPVRSLPLNSSRSGAWAFAAPAATRARATAGQQRIGRMVILSTGPGGTPAKGMIQGLVVGVRFARVAAPGTRRPPVPMIVWDACGAA